MTTAAALEFVVLGTGTSSAPPSIACLTDPVAGCHSCRSTLLPKSDPAHDAAQRNIRRNTSGVVRIPGSDGQREKTLLIDCGKTFLSGAIKFWPEKKLREIDAVLLTHPHADAILGLDDLRGWTLHGRIQRSIPIFANVRTYAEISKMFPYMADVSKATGGGDVPAFEWHVFEDDEVLDILGLRVRPLAVHHGQFFTTPRTPYLCLGFVIEKRFVYMSDVSFIPQEAWDVLEEECELPAEWRPEGVKPAAGLTIQSGEVAQVNGMQKRRKGRVEVCIMDSLRIENHTSHFGVAQAVEAVRRMGALRTYFVGFEHQPSHELWLHTLKYISSLPALATTSTAHQVPAPPGPGELWTLRTGSSDPVKEDWTAFREKAVEYVTMWEGGQRGPVWVRPACDGMTIRLEEGKPSDDVYDP